MRLSRKGEYALRAMTYLALNYDKTPVQIREISRREKIPEKFLEQILLQLKRAGLLDSRRGVHGGYVLLKPPKKISLADIIRTIDGALAPLGCVSKWAHVRCPEERKCGLRAVMLDVRNVVAQMLEGITLESVCGRDALRDPTAGRGPMSESSQGEKKRRRPPRAASRRLNQSSKQRKAVKGVERRDFR